MRLNCSGNSPSFAAASGISAQIIVQPFSAPKPEMMTTIAITLPAQVPPNMALTASENGAVESGSCVFEQDAEHGGQREHVDDRGGERAEDRRPAGCCGRGRAPSPAATAATSTPR